MTFWEKFHKFYHPNGVFCQQSTTNHTFGYVTINQKNPIVIAWKNALKTPSKICAPSLNDIDTDQTTDSGLVMKGKTSLEVLIQNGFRKDRYDILDNCNEQREHYNINSSEVNQDIISENWSYENIIGHEESSNGL